ncbi:MAG: hypothetical protein GDA48_07665 [Hormoscilla sp. GM102CHS1]|nr:hypothetical protein [Hormoscilla sp. GM102CHS1]
MALTTANCELSMAKTVGSDTCDRITFLAIAWDGYFRAPVPHRSIIGKDDPVMTAVHRTPAIGQ